MSNTDCGVDDDEIRNLMTNTLDDNDVLGIQGSGNSAPGQKRQRDERGGPASKKALFDCSNEEMVQVKILIPSAAVGALIGKGGETMRSLKAESGCRLQMSKNQEVYHATNERICLVKGKIAAVMRVVAVMMEKIREKVDSMTPPDIYDHKGVERSKEMKLLVPNTSAGMVIGKSGARIKEIRDQTGANIQVYPKAGSQEAKVSQERVITIAADSNEVLMNAIERVLDKVAADPQHAAAVDFKDNDSFGAHHGPSVHGQTIQPFDFNARSAVSNHFGSIQQTQFGLTTAQVWQPSQQRAIDAGFGSATKELYSNSNNQSSFKFNPMQGVGNSELMAFLDSLQSTLRSSGFNETSVSEVMQAMQVLAKYNIMGLGLGLGVAAMAQLRGNESSNAQSSLMHSQRFDVPSNSHNNLIDHPDRQYGNHLDVSKSLSGVGGVLIDVLSQSKVVGGQMGPNFASTVIKEKIVDCDHVELEVPDAIVGAVLGPKAKTLAEIQQLSGCKVEVHKRGSIAGSGNRLISLNGSAESIRNGRLMIEKVINDEQARRTQQSHHSRGTFI